MKQEFGVANPTNFTTLFAYPSLKLEFTTVFADHVPAEAAVLFLAKLLLLSAALGADLVLLFNGRFALCDREDRISDDV